MDASLPYAATPPPSDMEFTKLKEAMAQLAKNAHNFREACTPLALAGASPAQWLRCIRQPVSLKIISIAYVRHWFAHDVTQPQNAYKLILLELWCRARERKGASWAVAFSYRQFCRFNSSYIALKDYL